MNLLSCEHHDGAVCVWAPTRDDKGMIIEDDDCPMCKLEEKLSLAYAYIENLKNPPKGQMKLPIEEQL